MVNRAGPEAETGKGAEMGIVSGAEAGAGSVVETEMENEDDAGTETVEDTGLARGEELGTGIGEEAGPGSEDGTGRGEEMVKGAAPGDEALTSGGLWTSLRRGLIREDVGMGAREVLSVGVGSRPGVNVGCEVNTAGSPELGGRGVGANGGTGVSPSRGACLTTIFTTPVLFTMVGGICSGRGCPTASWRTWAPVKVSLLPWIWKVRGLLPPALATGRCASEANCPMLTTSPEGRRACISGDRMRRCGAGVGVGTAMVGAVAVVVEVVVAAEGKVKPGGTVRGFNRLEEPGGGAGLRRTGAGGAGFRDRVGVGGREVPPLRTPRGDGNTWGRGPLFGCSGGNSTGPEGRDAGISGGPAGEADTISGAGKTGGVGPGEGWSESSEPVEGRTGTGPRGVRGLFTTTTVRPSCLGTG